MKKQKVLYIIIIIIVMMATIVGISFAYFMANTNAINVTNVNVTFQDGVVANFHVSGDADIQLNVLGANMLSGTVNTAAATNTVNMNVSLQSDTEVYCTYDVVWNWDTNSDNYQLTETQNSDNEFTVSGTTGTLNISEIQVPNFSSRLVLGTFNIAANNTTTLQTWQFTGKFYNINANQDAHAGNTYKGKIGVENAVCRPSNAKFIAGTELNGKMKMFTNQSVTDETVNVHTVLDSTIKHFRKAETLNQSANKVVVSTPESDKPIYMWYDSSTNTILWYSDAVAVYLNELSNNTFNNLRAIETIETNTFKTDKATTMSAMFAHDVKLNPLDVSTFNTANVTAMSSMFANTRSLQSLDLSHFNTNKVTTMASMFLNNRALTSLNIQGWNTKANKNFSNMFAYLTKIPSLNVRTLNTYRGTNFAYMFRGLSLVTSLDVSTFKTANATNMMGMFLSDLKLTSLNVSTFNTYKVQNMANLFSDLRVLTSLTLNTTHFKTANVTNMYQMFYNMRKMQSLDLRTFNTYKVTDTSNMFNNGLLLKAIYVSNNFTVNNVTGTYTVNISGVNTTVNKGYRMFFQCNNLKGGNNTGYDGNIIDKTYARIDAAGTPGYFSAAELFPS